MAEYIDRAEVLELKRDYGDGQYTMMLIDPSLVKRLHTADVVAREEYDYLQSWNEILERQIAKSCDRNHELNELNGEMRKKIDRAINRVELLKLHQPKYITRDGKVCIDSEEVLKILKEI